MGPSSAIVDDFNKISLHVEALLMQLNFEPCPPRQLRTCMVWGLIKCNVYFVQLEPDNYSVGTIQRQGEFKEIWLTPTIMLLYTCSSI